MIAIHEPGLVLDPRLALRIEGFIHFGVGLLEGGKLPVQPLEPSMHASKRVPAKMRRAFQELALHRDPIPAHVSSRGNIVARTSSRKGSKRHCLYERIKIGERIVERLLCDNIETDALDVLRKRRVIARRRTRNAQILVTSGLKALPSWIGEVLDSLNTVTDRIVLVDEWAIPQFTSMTGYRGCPVAAPTDEIPLSIATKVDAAEIKRLLEQSGENWLSKSIGPGKTSLVGPTGTVLVYGETAGAPVAQTYAAAGQGIALLTNDAIAINCLSPVQQVFWDAWQAAARSEDAGYRNDRIAMLAEWAVANDPQCCEAATTWIAASPWSSRKAIQTFGAATQQMLATKQAAHSLKIDEPNNLIALWSAGSTQVAMNAPGGSPVATNASEEAPHLSESAEADVTKSEQSTKNQQLKIREVEDAPRPNWSKTGRAEYEALIQRIGEARMLIDAERIVLGRSLTALEHKLRSRSDVKALENQSQVDIANIRARLATMEASEAGFRDEKSQLIARLERDALVAPPKRQRHQPHVPSNKIAAHSANLVIAKPIESIEV